MHLLHGEMINLHDTPNAHLLRAWQRARPALYTMPVSTEGTPEAISPSEWGVPQTSVSSVPVPVPTSPFPINMLNWGTLPAFHDPQPSHQRSF